ncbi:hypothetical protein [Zhenhengia yiwuensis]|uniref:Uncharacterized protein n=1 Tax=Zhenhengia yiwuensis TaxID=2763666 RepID=A0A926IAY3_9FIRM|nr:hypothetical protein [Zhenhengia yiwuensis]MBC8581360.1 hypothetical protein [Zhenhengia yiwuensis]
MEEIDKKIAVLESKIKRQRITLSIFTVAVFFSTITSFSLRMKFDRLLDLLEEVVRLTTLLVN